MSDFCDECYGEMELCPKCHEDVYCPDCDTECFWCWMKANGNCDARDEESEEDD